MLKLIQSNQMEVLCAHLAAFLRAPLPHASILQSEHILVQSPGMSTWLRLEIAQQNGIAAALEFPLPSSFIWQLCHQLLPNVPKENAFTKPSMTWKLMQLLPKLLAHDAFGPLRHYLNWDTLDSKTPNHHESHPVNDQDDVKLYQLCGRIADIFDQYLVYRPDWIAAWEAQDIDNAPQLNNEQQWQPILWRALIEFNAAELGQSRYHRANLHSDLIDALKNPHTSISKLPKRLFVFGISSMAPQTIDVLHQLAGRIDVIILSLSPCQHYWGDIIDPRHRARMALQYAGKRQLAEQWEDKLEVGNPLLANNGKMGRELLDMLLELPEEHCDFGDDVYLAPCADPNDAHSNASMLQGVQYDILEMQTLDRVLGPDAELYQDVSHRRILKATDESIQINSCHSPLREVETLHDHLLDLLDRHSSLTVKDIVVMMPDVATYAPYIDAVFSAKQGLNFLPYAIADRGAAQESPLINSFLNLLKINQSRFGLTDILSILEVPAVLRRFRLNDDEFGLIRRWLDDAGVRWGRDEHSREQQGLPAFSQNSWAYGIKRLILGYAMRDDAPLYHDQLVVAGIEGQSAQALGKLLNFIEVLDETAKRLQTRQNSQVRLAELTALLDAFFESDEEEREQIQEIREAIVKLEEELLSAANAQSQPPIASEAEQHLANLDLKRNSLENNGLEISIDVLSQWFNQRLTESRVGQRYLAGSVNFCTLMPMRSIPFKVVCLLGMNDGVYPRVQHPVGFDLMAHFGARKGDRSRRLDDRYLFLEALLSARQQLYISFIGRSERDNSERIASMLVSELIEYCQLCYLPESLEAQLPNVHNEQVKEALLARIMCHQPLQPFDAKLYQVAALTDGHPNDLGVKQSYSTQWCPPTLQVGSDSQIKSRFIAPGSKIVLEDSQADSDYDANCDEFIDLSAFIRFFRNPAQYFFNRTLKVDLKLNIQADDNDEPFSLDGLQRYQLQAELIEDALDRNTNEPSVELLQRLKASGSLPMAPFDDLLLRGYAKDVAPMIERTLFLRGEQDTFDANICLNFTLNLDDNAPAKRICLEGRIDDISAKGLVSYRPGTAHGRDILALYLRHLCLMATGYSQTSYLLDMRAFHALAPIAPKEAHKLLTELFLLFYQGQHSPLCFMPRTALAYIQAEGEHLERLLEAKTEWLDEQGEKGEGLEPHYQRLFRFPEDFTEASFGHIAEQIYQPMVSLLHQDKLDALGDFVLNSTAHTPSTDEIQALSDVSGGKGVSA
ncbi:exodeoxyribonuclease V subunit gamma [Shewanella sp. A25]|nr:exodeoxyribonuclease V subunit gamma [Shewanella shenzhenensis]